jgi:hypothetical protein
MERWLNFYRAFFPSEEALRDFVEACEQLCPPRNTAKIMMHQIQRLVSIADDLPIIRPHDDSLRLLFLLMCAENIAKLHDEFKGQGQSRKFVQRFFEEFLETIDKDTLGVVFVDNSRAQRRCLGLRASIDMLYDIRCDVVHKGNYNDFAFHDGRTSMVNTNPDIESHITFENFRAIVVRGCINAVQARLIEH